MAVIFGIPEESPEHQVFNSAIYAEAGTIKLVHRKVHLPTYGMFDEQRYFGAGHRMTGVDTPFGRVGMLICEDMWHLSSGVILQAENVHMIVCLSNSPTRGIDERGLTSAEAWRGIGRVFARFLGVVVVFANRVGYEDGIHFWGGSEVVMPDGRALVEGDSQEEQLLTVTIDPAEIRRERIASPLARDERLLVTIEELERIRRERYS